MGRTQSRCIGPSVAPQYAQPAQASRSASHWSDVRSCSTPSMRRFRRRAARALRLPPTAMPGAYGRPAPGRSRRSDRTTQTGRTMNPIELETGAHLDALEPWRAAEFAAHMERAREHIRPWVGPSFLSDDVAGAHATLTRYAGQLALDGQRIYGIWADGVLVGGVMFVAFSAAAGVCEVGCWS